MVLALSLFATLIFSDTEFYEYFGTILWAFLALLFKGSDPARIILHQKTLLVEI